MIAAKEVRQVVYGDGRRKVRQATALTADIVIAVDGRGTPGRGRAFERALKEAQGHGNFSATTLDDQIEAALMRQVLELDTAGADGRIGIIREYVAAADLDRIDPPDPGAAGADRNANRPSTIVNGAMRANPAQAIRVRHPTRPDRTTGVVTTSGISTSRLASASLTSSRAAPICGSRSLRSFSRHRLRSRRIDWGVPDGSLLQSGVARITAAIVSAISSPPNTLAPVSIS